MTRTRNLVPSLEAAPVNAYPPPVPAGPRRPRRSALILAVLAMAACQEPTAEGGHAHEQASLARFDLKPSDLLKEVRRETSRFHSIEQAVAAGYAPTAHCVASPLGGMGLHFANMGLVDPVFDPLLPEVLLYEPMPNGRARLVAVEYLVINVGQPRPHLDGYPFDIGGTPTPVPHWSLHVWLHRDNPNGIFTPFNPTVSCE